MTYAKLVFLFLFIIFYLFLFGCTPETGGDALGAPVYEAADNHDPLHYFDYTSIDIQKTAVIDLELKNLNLYADMYGNLVVLGEVVNKSETHKSDIVFTFDFLDRQGQNVFSIQERSKTRYLLSGQTMPFWLYTNQKDKYIAIDALKIGVNYNNYYDRVRGNPVAQEERFYYQDQKMIIEGQLINLGTRRIEDLVLLATFYNYMGKVVFVRECYLPLKALGPQERQPFELNILLDQYLPDFTSYSLRAFFRDSISLETQEIEIREQED